MSSLPSICSKRWIKFPNVLIPCLQAIAEHGIEEFKKKHEVSLIYKNVVEGWYKELDDHGNTIRYRLHIQAYDCIRRLLKFEAVLLQQHAQNNEKSTITLESFEQIISYL
uniref:Phloem filament protein n=1 Tax=Cucumis sativus TaxID=3659 RepID=A0A0A0K471_CUCSA